MEIKNDGSFIDSSISFVDENVKIFNDDAYSFIEILKNNNIKVNHIICDPPYNISQDNNFQTLNSAKRKGLDFGEWDKQFDLYSWIDDYADLILDGGSFIIFSSYRYISFLVERLECCGFIVKDIIRWVKSNPMPRNVNRRYVQDVEFAIWAVKNKGKWTFNKPENEKYLRAEFKTPTVLGRERSTHPTQKSLRLMSDLIKIHTNINDLILDPFMGSGTTGVAAIENKRKFIGIEISSEYYEIAKERLHGRKNKDK